MRPKKETYAPGTGLRPPFYFDCNVLFIGNREYMTLNLLSRGCFKGVLQNETYRLQLFVTLKTLY